MFDSGRGRDDDLLYQAEQVKEQDFFRWKERAEARAGREITSAEFAAMTSDERRAAAGVRDEPAPAPSFGFETDARVANLIDRFVVPPFSVLDTRQGYWLTRRREWLTLGIKGELGRGEIEYDADGRPFSRAAPSGSLMPAMGQTGGGPLVRGDGAGRAVYDHKIVPGGGGGGAWMHGGSGERKPYDPKYGAPAYNAGPAVAVKAQGSLNAILGSDSMATGTSIFDPVLCELAYRWWCPEGGTVLDPFAGGSVRGIVASRLGHPYVGIDLSGHQLAANRAQADAICEEQHPPPSWLHGDARAVLGAGAGPHEVDLVFTCPPYGDLEVYSDDPADLSAMKWPDFVEAYDAIIRLACERLKPGRFAVIAVSEIRGPDGAYRGLVPATIEAFLRAGLRYYNECILVNSIGSLPIRIGRQFEAGRKIGRTHQNVLVFAKGEPERGWSYEREAPPSPQLSMFG